MPLVPTYPNSSTQFLPSSRCTVRFHCCVLGTTKCRGTSSTNRFCVLFTPGPVHPPYVAAPFVSGKLVSCARQGSHAADKEPATGTALGFVAGVPVKKSDIVNPGVCPKNTIGMNGDWKLNWSTAPTSSRT